MIHFNWEDEESWGNIPDVEVPLVITIPPILKELKQEQARLRKWCIWMKSQRNKIKRVVYISTTGVYPNRSGTWEEIDIIDPDTHQGQLRFSTERILSDFFNTRILRAGAIYGPDRHIGNRVNDGRPIPKGNQTIHRVHVSDLANITVRALLDNTFPAIVNVVDHDNSPSEKVAQWIVRENFYGQTPLLNLQDNFVSRNRKSQAPDRNICNRILAETLGYKFLYPTFKDGLKHAIKDHYNQPTPG
ncbi:MAG: hypothetical protein GY786_21185 [Proteobacteria bacterium]|nr:hypothetical protein [Pseudomonadota bacterium]